MNEVLEIFTESSSGSEKYYRARVGESTGETSRRGALLINDLGWTQEEAAEVRARLASFAVGWDAPGMDAYDDL
jgi:hypothetical protein